MTFEESLKSPSHRHWRIYSGINLELFKLSILNDNDYYISHPVKELDDKIKDKVREHQSNVLQK